MLSYYFVHFLCAGSYTPEFYPVKMVLHAFAHSSYVHLCFFFPLIIDHLVSLQLQSLLMTCGRQLPQGSEVVIPYQPASNVCTQ